MHSRSHAGTRRWIQHALVALLVAYCLFSVWMLVEAYRSYAVISSAELHDYDTRTVVSSCVATAKSWTGVIAALSFFAGIAVVTIYQVLRHDRDEAQ